MALTINTALPEVLLCGIPSYLGLTTTRTILTPGTLAVNVWTKTSGITNGSIFPVHWLGNKLTFAVVTTPDDSGMQLPAWSNASQFVAFYDALRLNYYINRDFTVNMLSGSAPYSIQLVAKNKGIAYITDEDANTAMNNTVLGVDDVYAENFSVVADVYVKQGDDFLLYNTIDASPAADNVVRLYVPDLLKPKIHPAIPQLNDIGAALVNKMAAVDGAVLYYYIRYFESYGNPPRAAVVQEWGTAIAPKLAISLRLPRLEQPNNTAQSDYITSTTARHLLRNERTRYMKAGCVDYPAVYLDGDDMGTVTWYRRVYFTDGTDTGAGIINQKNMDANTPPEVYQCVVLWDDALTIETAQSKTIDYVTVYARQQLNSSTLTSKVQRYEKDAVVSEFTWHFIYRNPRGMWESIYFTGHITNLALYERVEAQLQGRDDYVKSDSEIYTYNHTCKSQYKLGTGLKYPDEMPGLREFAESDAVYIREGNYGDTNAFWRPVVVNADAFSTLDGSDGELEERSFTFTNAVVDLC